MNLIARLPAGRLTIGSLTLAEGPQELFMVPCYGKADNAAATAAGNPTRDPLRPFGDFPLGLYRVTPYIIPTDQRKLLSPTFIRTYGPYGYLICDPEEGDARTAARNGRFGLRVHSGALDARGRLRATHGCLRCADDALLRILEALRGHVDIMLRAMLAQAS